MTTMANATTQNIRPNYRTPVAALKCVCRNSKLRRARTERQIICLAAAVVAAAAATYGKNVNEKLFLYSCRTRARMRASGEPMPNDRSKSFLSRWRDVCSPQSHSSIVHNRSHCTGTAECLTRKCRVPPPRRGGICTGAAIDSYYRAADVKLSVRSHTLGGRYGMLGDWRNITTPSTAESDKRGRMQRNAQHSTVCEPTFSPIEIDKLGMICIVDGALDVLQFSLPQRFMVCAVCAVALTHRQTLP